MTSSVENDPADQRLFVVSEEAFDAFMARLDRPAEVKPQLAELLARPTYVTPPASTKTN